MLNPNCKWQKDKSNHMTQLEMFISQRQSRQTVLFETDTETCVNTKTWGHRMMHPDGFFSEDKEATAVTVWASTTQKRNAVDFILSYKAHAAHKHATRGNKKPRLTGRTWKVLGYHHIKVCLNAFTQYYSARWGKQMKASFFCSDVKPQLEDSH